MYTKYHPQYGAPPGGLLIIALGSGCCTDLREADLKKESLHRTKRPLSARSRHLQTVVVELKSENPRVGGSIDSSIPDAAKFFPTYLDANPPVSRQP